MPTAESVRNALEVGWSTVQAWWVSLLASPYHLRLYIAIGAAVVFVLLLEWAMPGRRTSASLSLNQPAPRQKGLSRSALNELSLNQPASEPLQSAPAARPGAITPAWTTVPAGSNVTPIDRNRGARCTHCNAVLGASPSFCPACGYAQPVTQTGTATRL